MLTKQDYNQETARLARKYGWRVAEIRKLFPLTDFQGEHDDEGDLTDAADEFMGEEAEHIEEEMKEAECSKPERPLSDPEIYFRNFGTMEGY